MKLTLKHFRCYRDEKRFELNRGMICIRGNSGKGKSTIVTAILWVLYGKERDVVPTGTNLKTEVTLEINDIFKIVRSKKPEMLKVIYNTAVYDGDIAQSIIDGVFLPYELFRCTSCASIDDHNIFLYMSQTERSRILEMLSMNGDLAKKYESLDSMIKEKKKLIDTTEEEIKIIDGMLKSYPQEYLNVQMEIDVLIEEFDRRMYVCKEEWKRYTEGMVTRNSIEKELERNQRFTVDTDPLKRRLIELEKEREIAKIYPTYLKAKQYREQLSKMEQQIDPNIEPDESVTLHDIEKARYAESTNKYYAKILEEAKIVDLDEEIRSVGKIVERIDDYQILDRRNTLMKLIDPQLPPTDVIKEWLNGLRTQSLMGKSMECPKCKTSLHVKDNCLVEGTGEHFDSDKLIKAEKLYIMCIERDKHRAELNGLKEITDLEPIPKEMLEKHCVRYRLLNSIQRPPPIGPRSSDDLQRVKIQTDLRSDYRSIQEQLGHLGLQELTDLPTPRSIQAIDKEETQVRTTIEQVLSFSSIREKLKIELSQINPVKPETTPEKIQIDIDKFKEIMKIQAFETKRDRLIDLRDSELKPLEDMKTLKEEMQKAEFESFNEFINTLNGWLASVCADIFNTDLIVQLSLTKSMKTTKEVKNNINLYIKYEGHEREFSSMSRGERDRISTAFTVALFKATDSKILLLDEVGASLHLELRDRILKKLGSMKESAYIINIVHNESEEYFDSIISL